MVQTEDPKNILLGATVQNLLARAVWRPGFVSPCPVRFGSWVKRPECGAEYSPPSGTEIKNPFPYVQTWLCT